MQILHDADAHVRVVMAKEAIRDREKIRVSELWAENPGNFVA